MRALCVSVHLTVCMCVSVSFTSFVLKIGLGKKQKQNRDGLCSSGKFSNDLTCTRARGLKYETRTHTQAHSQIVSLPCRPSPCPLCQRSSFQRKWGAERGRCYCLLENTLRQTRAWTNMHRQSDKSASISTLLMEILPSRCALLEEHIECETGLCMRTGSEPVTTIWAAPGGYRRCVCVAEPLSLCSKRLNESMT